MLGMRDAPALVDEGGPVTTLPQIPALQREVISAGPDSVRLPAVKRSDPGLKVVSMPGRSDLEGRLAAEGADLAGRQGDDD